MNVPKTVKLGHRVFIEWIDSSVEHGWQNGREPSIATIRSIGILLSFDKISVAITTSISTGGNSLSVLSIPWCAVNKFKQYESLLDDNYKG